MQGLHASLFPHQPQLVAHRPSPLACSLHFNLATGPSQQPTATRGRCRRREERRSQQPLAAATDSSSPSLERFLAQHGSPQGNGVLFTMPPAPSLLQQQRQQQQQQQGQLEHDESPAQQSSVEFHQDAEQRSNGNHELPLQGHGHRSRKLRSRIRLMANNGAGRGAADSEVVSAVPQKLPLQSPPCSPRAVESAAGKHAPASSCHAAHAQQQSLSLILYPPPEPSSPPDPAPTHLSHASTEPALQPALQPPQQPCRGPHATVRRPPGVVGGRWGKWVLHMRPWFALLRPWWCRKGKRRRRPKPNRFRMTISRTSDLDVLHEFRLHQQHQQHQQHQHQQRMAPDLGWCTPGSRAREALITTLILQPRHIISSPAHSSIHTLGGAPSNANQPFAHFTRDGGRHWTSAPFHNVRTSGGATVLAAQLDCSPSTSSSSTSSSSQSGRSQTGSAASEAAAYGHPCEPQEAAAAASVLQVVVSKTPHPPMQDPGAARWRHHVLQLQPGRCYMVEEAATRRKRVRSTAGAHLPLSVASDMLLLPLAAPTAAPSTARRLPPPHLPLKSPLPVASQAARGRNPAVPVVPPAAIVRSQAPQWPQHEGHPQPPLFHRLLLQPVVLVASVHMVAGRQRCPQDDMAARRFQTMWRHSSLLHPSLLVYTTHRCWRSYLQLWKDKQHVLEQPDVLILANGTRIMYQVAGGGWQEDVQWRAVLNKGWDRRQVVQAVEAVVARMNALPLDDPPQPWSGCGAAPAAAPAAAAADAAQQGLRGPMQESTSKQQGQSASCGLTPMPTTATPLACAHGALVPSSETTSAAGVETANPWGQGHAPAGAAPPATRVRADVVKEQNSHRVRILVRAHAADALLAALQAELESAQGQQQRQQPQQEEQLQQSRHDVQHPQQPSPPFSRPHAQQLHLLTMQPSKRSGSGSGSNDAFAVASQGSTTYVAPPQLRTSQREQQHPHPHHQHPQLLHQAAIHTHSSGTLTRAAGLGWAATNAAALAPLTWSLVLQPPHVLGQGRGWAAVDVLPGSAGVGPAVAHVLARFSINAPSPRQQRPQAASVPVVACTNSAQDHESLRQVATDSITYVAVASCKRAQAVSSGGQASGGEQVAVHRLPRTVESHAWGAQGVLEGLAKLGLS